MTFREYLQKNIVYLDGGMGTLLQAQGLQPGEQPETWNVLHPERIIAIHQSYFDAGSNLICTNTFGANSLKFSRETLCKLICEAVRNANTARSRSTGTQEKFIALDIGPTGKLLKPLGDLDFEDAVAVFAETVRLGVAQGVDAILIETMNDSLETKAALLAAKENCSLPVLVSNAYGADGKLMTGASPQAMVALLEGMGADAIGANCSLGPRQLEGVMDALLQCASVPVLFKPNAGLPQAVEGNAVYDVDPEEFACQVGRLLEKGVRAAGGCCGTTPDYIRALTARTKGLSALPVTPKNLTVAASYTHAVTFGEAPVIIGERINPTGKKRLRQALLQEDMDYILSEGIRQQEKGAQILDVNVGLPEVEEKTLLPRVSAALQEVVDLPLQLDSADPEAMEAALRRYNGKAVINSVSGKQSSMEAVFPLVKKYGGLVVALTLDEAGIPATAQGRVDIARRILAVAQSYGIGKHELLFDPLAMTVSADPQAAVTALEAVQLIRRELGCHTVMGVSNVSYGLPEREALNSTFLAMALERGLSGAILNPDSQRMLSAVRSFCLLSGQDPNCESYLAWAAGEETQPQPSGEETQDLQKAILTGRKELAARLTQKLLASQPPLAIVDGYILPALNRAGEGFEAKKVYLPQLLMCAEAAKSAFSVIREAMQPGKTELDRGVFVLATVKGDIHDIGKNIVKLLLENYGFRVVDLGKDVPPEKILEKTVALHAPFVGLSALMTTTVPAMEQTIRLLKAQAPWCKTVVGGAVLTREYAQRIGADFYAKDAMAAVRYAESML